MFLLAQKTSTLFLTQGITATHGARLACRMALAASLLASPSAFAQDALVTFYTHGSRMKGGLPGTKNGIYFGKIYDGDQQLFSFYEGVAVKNNRFVTLQMPAGNHNFSASYKKKPSDEHRIQIELEPGKHYFFRAQSESSGVIVWEFEKGRLDQVSCSTAQSEAAEAKPLVAKQMTPALKTMSVHQQSIPTCSPIVNSAANESTQ
jgi:hypothetical protein